MNFFNLSIKRTSKGFGLIEVIIAVTLFVVISLAIYNGFSQLMRGLKILETKNVAINLANEKIEIARNLPYKDVGLVDGIPEGKLLPEETVTKRGISFDVVTAVRNVDDPFDGTFDGDPQDEAPNDYKIVQIDVSCPDCLLEEVVTFYTKISPQNLETGDDNGALFLRAFDSRGQPIQGANISVFSDDSTSTIDINDVSDSEGYLKIYDVPPGVEAYEIEVSKDGYSTEQTYASDGEENPLPDRPHLNVLAGEITTDSFSIDELSDLSLNTKNNECSVISNVDLNMHGSKTIGHQIYKYDNDFNSGSSGLIDIDNLEWDNYSIDVIDSSYELYGASTLLPIKVNPDSDQDVDLIIGPNSPNMLLVQIQDTATDLPLSDATITLSKDDFQEIKVTGNGFINQTDWSGGSGQEEYIDETRFYSSDNGIDYTTQGQITLDSFDGDYLSDGYLESSIIDLGTTSNFRLISWLNESHPEGTLVKTQIATNEIITSTSTWDFVGPDGQASSYYTTSGDSVYGGHDGDRYLKYKIFLESNVSTSTPLISDINFTYSSGCVAPGQVMFNNLESGTYHIKVERDGYTTFEIIDLEINENWEMLNVPMTQ